MWCANGSVARMPVWRVAAEPTNRSGTPCQGYLSGGSRRVTCRPILARTLGTPCVEGPAVSRIASFPQSLGTST